MAWRRKHTKSVPAATTEPGSVPPPAATESPAGQSFGCVGAIVGGILGVAVVVALGIWGGAVGRVVIAAFGFGVAGVFFPLPLTSVVGSGKLAEWFLLSLCAICALVGVIVGIWFGVSGEELPWWAYAGTGAVAAICGGVGGWAVAGVRTR